MADVRLRDLNPAVLDYGLTVAGKVGIGKTGPATMLDIEDDGTGLRLSRGTVDLRLSDNAANGNVGTESNHNLYIRTNATDRITITNSGLVGIGEGAPTAKLHVGDPALNATALTTATRLDMGLKLSFTSPSNTENHIFGGISMGGTGEEYVGMYAIDGGSGGHADLALFTGDSSTVVEAIRILSDGKVGIGTTAPANLLHVLGNSANGEIKAERASGAVSLLQAQASLVRFGATSNHDLHLISNDDTKVTIKTSGNVGIGTTSPAEELHVVSSSTGTIRLDGSAVNLEIQAQGSTRASVGTITNHPLRLISNNTERVTVLSDGKVGIGITSPTETLHVNGNLKVTGSVEVGASGFNVSTGFILAFGVAAPPSGWLACNGSAVSRTTYSDLYALIGTTYGAGDGSTTFNVPDLRGRTLIGTDGLAAGSFTANLGTLDNIGGIGGAQNHTLTTAELPSHTHSQRGQSGCGHDNCNGGWAASIYEHRASSSSRNIINNIDSTGGGGSHNTVQPSLAISYLIKT